MLIPLKRSGSPKKLIYTTFNTPFGKTGVAATPYGICRVALSIQSESKFVEALKTTYHSPKKQPHQSKIHQTQKDNNNTKLKNKNKEY